MSDDEAMAKAAKTDADATKGGKRGGWGSWALGWVLVPGLIIGLLFGSGALVGAHFHDSWFVRAIVWFVGLFT